MDIGVFIPIGNNGWLISTTSPIGRALINKEPGDTVKVTTPGGTREFEIVKLTTIHDEDAG